MLSCLLSPRKPFSYSEESDNLFKLSPVEILDRVVIPAYPQLTLGYSGRARFPAAFMLLKIAQGSACAADWMTSVDRCGLELWCHVAPDGIETSTAATSCFKTCTRR